MAFIIQRIISKEDLLKRPRVSAEISTSVFNFINENMLIPKNVLQSDKYIFHFTLNFNYGIVSEMKSIISRSPYATSKRLFTCPNDFTVHNKINKMAMLSVHAEDIDEHILPKEYADLVYNMFADFLISKFKKIRKEEIDALKKKLNYELIESLDFPAPFEKQKYLFDEDEMLVNNVLDPAGELVMFKPKEKYISYYGF